MKKQLLLTLFTLLSISHFAWAQPVASPKSSLQKIEEALEKKEISEANAAGYRVLSFFASPSLPTQFQSDENARESAEADLFLSEAPEHLPDMDEALAAEVYNQMIPPPYRQESTEKRVENFPTPGKIPDRAWNFVESDIYGVKVWYHRNSFEEERLAQIILGTLINEVIPAEEALMGRKHMSDSMVEHAIRVRHQLVRYWSYGGDKKLDVYLYDFNRLPKRPFIKAWVQRYPFYYGGEFSCPAGPSYMAVNKRWATAADIAELSSTLAHEYFHVLQFTFDRKGTCRHYSRMDEGTANYLKHHVFPNYNSEHDWFYFSEDGTLSLLNESYSTWPFYLYATKTHGDNILPTLYETMSTLGAYESLNRLLDGGFKKHWLEYAVKEWNQAPLSDSFLQWDNYDAVPGRGAIGADDHLPPITPEQVVLDANGQYRYEMNLLLPPLTRNVFAFDLSNEEVRSVAINNPVRGAADKINAKILARRKGSDQFEEILWEDNNRIDYLYCMDKKNQNYDLFVIIMANFEHNKAGQAHTPSPVFSATNQACHGLKGTIKGRIEIPLSGIKTVIDVTVSDFEVRETGKDDDSNYKNKFLVVGGSITYTTSGKLGNCETNMAGSLPLLTGEKAKGVQLDSYRVAPDPYGYYHVNVRSTETMINVIYTCPPPLANRTYSFPFTLTSTMQMPYAHHGGNPNLKGEAKMQGISMSWDLKPISEQ